ncbi:MAG: TlpA family protein disulfide reductase [Candidatus Hodarchaeales archaeon]
MARRTFKPPSKKDAVSQESEEEKYNSILSSLDKISTKQKNIIRNPPAQRPIVPIILGIVFVGIIAVSLLGMGLLPAPNQNEDLFSGNISDSLNFKIELLNGSEVYLDDLGEGKPIILDFMATWCSPCKTQITHLKSLRSSHPGVLIISISVDLVSDSLEKLQQYATDNAMTWFVGRDISKRGSQIYNTVSIPTLAFINSEGKLKQWASGVQTYDTLVSWINTG